MFLRQRGYITMRYSLVPEINSRSELDILCDGYWIPDTL